MANMLNHIKVATRRVTQMPMIITSFDRIEKKAHPAFADTSSSLVEIY
jgi:hypothetical protein